MLIYSSSYHRPPHPLANLPRRMRYFIVATFYAIHMGSPSDTFSAAQTTSFSQNLSADNIIMMVGATTGNAASFGIGLAKRLRSISP